MKCIQLTAIKMSVIVLAAALLSACQSYYAQPSLSRAELKQYDFNSLTLKAGNRINYRVQGENNQKTLLMVHGGGDSLSVWNRWADQLQQDYRVIRIDMPGHGLSDPYPDGQYNTVKIADSIGEVVDLLQLNEFVLVAHSYGGEASLHYIQRQPDKVKALVLVAPGAYKPEWEDIKDYVESFNQSYLPGKSGVRQSLQIMFADPARIGDEIVDYSYDLYQYQPNWGTLQAMEQGSADHYQEVSGTTDIKVPTLLLWGDQDKVSNLNNIGRRLHREIPDSELVVYPDVGHMPNYAIATQSVKDVQKFLKDRVWSINN
ncbi:alpha/beta fold hydrolase [Bacterioplanoides sp.]|uniref:alpha/beta fold hydrolase n=1 Tax=Bacterioplanoides sp. TaxID=2066072 RepID=UPI003B5B9550